MFFFVFFVFFQKSFCQMASEIDSSIIKINSTTNTKKYNVGKGKIFEYSKPKAFSFLTNLPKDFAGIGKAPFKKNTVKPVLLVAASTALLVLADQSITDGVDKFSSNIGLSAEEKYKNIINIKLGKTDVSIYKVPLNLNTAFYQLGQGFPSLILGAGLFTYGKIHKDYKALSTANQ
jgi:hypothetical protein